MSKKGRPGRNPTPQDLKIKQAVLQIAEELHGVKNTYAQLEEAASEALEALDDRLTVVETELAAVKKLLESLDK